ncbi:flagellar motor protein MotB, partial [Novimethylophilus kurashikiensis]
MNTLELLYEAKRKLGVSSDYALAQKLEIPRQRMTDYKTGSRQPDTYTLTRLAIVLERDPMSLIAEFEASTEKNPIRKEFWKGFLLRQNSSLVAILILALIYGPFYAQDAQASYQNSGNPYNQKVLHSVTLC